MIQTDEYTSVAGFDHRRRLAQFFTPPAIARFMSEWALGGNRGGELYDPAFGLGAFFLNAPEGCHFSGADVDETVLEFFRANSPRMPDNLSRCDYLLDFGKRFGNIVCNPPYLRFQKFLNRDAASVAFRERLGVRLSGYTNIASAFLVKSISELKDGGRLAYILPSEFLNAGYGALVKDWLIRDGHLDSIIEVECENDAFEEVTTSICIVLYDSSRRIEDVSFRRIRSLDEIMCVMETPPVRIVPRSHLNVGHKWGRYFVAEREGVRPSMWLLRPLSEYGRFSRGIATGANEFFVLSESRIRENGLSSGSYVPCITKSQQLTGLIFDDKDFRRLAEADKAVFLFSPGDAGDESSARYIRRGERMGYNQRFITRHRTPWYRTESRAVSPLLLNVFSRTGYKVVRNYSSALTLTTFHCFCPYPMRARYVDWLFLYLHSGIGRKILSLSKRKYGNSLDKFEPNDLNDALVPTQTFFDALGNDTLFDLMSAVKAGEDPSVRLDEMFAPLADGGKGDVEEIGVLHEPKPVQLSFAI